MTAFDSNTRHKIVQNQPDFSASAQLGNMEFFDNLMNYSEAAQYLSISESYLRKLVSTGKMRSVRVAKRVVRFRKSTLNRWAQQREA